MPAYLQLERAYKSHIRLLDARLKLSQAQTGAAEAREEVQECLLQQQVLRTERVQAQLRGEAA